MTVVAENRGTRYRYHIEDRVEAGLILKGSEVKSLRAGHVSLNKAHAMHHHDGFYLINAHIGHYAPAAKGGHAPRRARKLLLHKNQIVRLAQAVKQSGITLVPTKIYFSPEGLAKVELGLARGKKKHDRRREIKQKEWRRRKEILLRSKR